MAVEPTNWKKIGLLQRWRSLLGLEDSKGVEIDTDLVIIGKDEIWPNLFIFFLFFFSDLILKNFFMNILTTSDV